MKSEIHQLKENDIKLRQENEIAIKIKDEKINELTKEIEELNENNTKLKINEEKLLEQTKQLENEIKMLLKSHENEIQFLISKNADTEMQHDQMMRENKKLLEENSNLQKEIENFKNEMNIIKSALETNEEKLQEKCLNIEKLTSENVDLLNEIQNLKKEIEENLKSYTDNSEKMLKELNELKVEKERLSNELTNRQELIQSLQEELIDKDVELDTYRDNLKESYQEDITKLTKKYEQQITTLKELNDMKIKEMESINLLQTSKIIRDYQDQMKDLEKRTKDEIDRAHEIAEEKIRIAEIQNEQKIKALEKNLEDAIEYEKKLWSNEMDKCQKIAETEIIQYELEKQDLKTLLESANEMLKERDEKIKNLETKLTNGIDYYIKINEQLEMQINDIKQECARIMTEKYNYQLTLNNTRSTVNILMERLKKSDSDVETLKIDIEALRNSKSELIMQNTKLENELYQMKKELDEYKNALTSLRNSSQALEREMKEKETLFEKLMTSEEETLETVNKIGKLFNERIEENIDKYFEMYMDLKRKYESRETYIKDMKTLLDDFATGIELARLELDTKDKHLLKLEDENKNIKLENMTLKYRCEQFEKYHKNNEIINAITTVASSSTSNDIATTINQMIKDNENPEKDTNITILNNDTKIESNSNNDNDELIDKRIIDNVLSDLNNDIEIDCDKIYSSKYQNLDINKILEENKKLKTTLSEQIRRNDLLQEMIELESENAIENAKLKKKVRNFISNCNFLVQRNLKNTVIFYFMIFFLFL